MKCHYPAELVCALINSQPMGFYSVNTLIAEARRQGVCFQAVNPHQAQWHCSLHTGSTDKTNSSTNSTVQLGFCSLRKIRRSDVEHMLLERAQRPFRDFADFVLRTIFPREALETLSLADVFVVFGLDRRHTFWQSLELTRLLDRRKNEQLMLFNEHRNIDFQQLNKATDTTFRPTTLKETIQLDMRLQGYSLHGHIMRALRIENPLLPRLTAEEFKKLPPRRRVRFAGVMSMLQRPPPAQGTAFITLEDDTGSVDSILRPEIFDRYADLISRTPYLIFSGQVQSRGSGRSLLVDEVGNFPSPNTTSPCEPL
jgi:error-prone DNA polymerase